jgi:diguanylate cyclase (GGDEF)-like protein
VPEPFPTSRWEPHLSPRDAVLIDAGATGERTVALARMIFTAILAAIPVQSIVANPGLPENYIGLAWAAISFTVAVAVYVVVRRGFYRPWLSIATSTFDVTGVSAMLATFIVIGLPQIAVNSRLVYEIYLIALAGTCLRYDRRAPVIAGAVAVVQYAGIVVYVRDHWNINDPRFLAYGYGTFSWADQMGRLIIIAVSAAVSWSILRRAERLRTLSTHDPLTGLLNRNVLEDRIREEVIRARRYERPLSIAMVDLDFFKTFNDEFGHAAGDRALRAFSNALRNAVRRTDIVARFGGEEFVVVLPETAGPDAALKVEQIRREVEALSVDVTRGHIGHLTMSAGVASLSPESDEALEILHRADALLLAAKREGRNCVVAESGPVSRTSAA